jgi:hypothetical protein
LSHPEIIITELEKLRHDANRVGVLETELKQAERQFKAVDCINLNHRHYPYSFVPTFRDGFQVSLVHQRYLDREEHSLFSPGYLTPLSKELHPSLSLNLNSI